MREQSTEPTPTPTITNTPTDTPTPTSTPTNTQYWVYEVFTAVVVTPHETQVTYMGQYALKHYDWPIIGWLVHRFIVRPRYDAAIARHLERIKRIAEHEQPL